MTAKHRLLQQRPPNSNANDGTVSRISITNIGLEGQEITLSIAFGDTYEPNDELGEAFPIQFNQTYESFIYDQKDTRDLYRTDAISGEAIVATLLNSSDAVDYELSILNESGQQIATAERVNSVELQIIFQPTQTGRFYISVASRSGFQRGGFIPFDG